MPITHYINTQADDPARARVSSPTNRAPVSFPPFVLGDTRSHDWRPITSTGAIDTSLVSAGNTFRVSLGRADDRPWGGSFSMACGESTDAIDATSDAEEVSAILNQLATVESEGGVRIIAGSRHGAFFVSWLTTGAKTALTASAAGLIPKSGIAINTIIAGSASANQLVSVELRRDPLVVQDYWTRGANGWTGRLAIDTPECLEELTHRGERVGEYIQVSTTLSVEVIDSASRSTTIYQGTVLLRAKTLALEALTDSPMSGILTGAVALENYVQNRTGITGLSSIVSNPAKLGGIDTADGEMPTGANVMCKFTGDVVALFELVSGTDAESAPWVIRPWDYDVSTNARIWALRSVHRQGVPCTWNADTSKFHQLLAGGAANSVFVAVEQTGFALPE